MRNAYLYWYIIGRYVAGITPAESRWFAHAAIKRNIEARRPLTHPVRFGLAIYGK